MGKFSRVEDRPTPPEVYNWRVYFAAVVATFAAVMIGYDSAFIGTSISLPSFKAEFGLLNKSTSELNLLSANIVSFYQAGFGSGREGHADIGQGDQETEYSLQQASGRTCRFLIDAWTVEVDALQMVRWMLDLRRRMLGPWRMDARPIEANRPEDDSRAVEFAAFFGSILGYPLGYYWGRKYGLLTTAFVFCVGAVLQCVASSKTGLGVLYAGRVIVGLAIGGASNLAPIYVAEISPPAIRGRLIGMYELCWQIGGVIGFWINYGVTQNIPAGRTQWLIAFAVQLIPGGLLLALSPLLTESPRWLVSRSLPSRALNNLAYLRSLPPTHPYVEEEFAAIEATIAHERSLAGAGFLGPMRTVFGKWDGD
ncbi:hypothetical protein BDQ12DRAFT_710765 [Crucibulum laeve]|uniref:Major facilitator superfamily (MFS) profile domain-containing protein n=1 Tax=Crucibulum laeve TaxID=68775 RepID=A0A5C3MD40_9AGAR|nr:hypothetical protein BDQ12DRAFT_710765 [Crucibulum laeve]